MRELAVRGTEIPGLWIVDMPVHGDNRGWFKENWQREKMAAHGLPDFEPVQNNVSFNANRGATRGIHAEPWDKLISIVNGSAFCAWVDLREGETFGRVATLELGVDQAVFVPKGVGNSYQALEDETIYSYLVNEHWSPEASYTFVNLADETLGIEWPIALSDAELSEKDRRHPPLADVTPFATDEVALLEVDSPRTLVIGAGGQLGRALVERLPHATAWDVADLDITDPGAVWAVNWSQFDTIINAAAYTAVDAAETLEGRRAAWLANAHAPAHLAKAAVAHDLTLVHVSSDYVFDGERETHAVDESFAPLGVYGQSKAAGDVAVSVVPKHYVVRTSWVIGDGANFIRTMQSLAEKGVDPAVVDDQVGRLTYTSDLADGIITLLRQHAPYGTVNVTSGGEPRSWFEIARQAFADAGHDPQRVSPTSTEEYGRGKQLAPRPRFSTLE
ncbi:dTDP-4-dehydrorhamnose reductase/dTDP-4-dehydrorhamnose 3,5-epimerase [Aeromicrobium sp. SORGH_AS981]|uniref:bifunctional dTDP-4-dehydrorhamnose 3,5-epimerase family protein/NAD(P)-dependent oxidoreductase n=1 Tax=Aeromicrobium sp. SORGH_AS_0981 TaxID=3041802 RepID=UPI0028570402|nr:bifunctional dTDP-4-dehydrorhamnose 3,5-epimerase family protein/NAD(P)-dependent oxidoreductase [Aeromicrobium sp. SORGH_AS_0981]MDR6117568.1 dTDP-4-dehydrorhamnose reductase/dTDP-4-dehydrorhamnose 3,5-epimerase [Aeromicrobium sp. SORGH_AS_0981]